MKKTLLFGVILSTSISLGTTSANAQGMAINSTGTPADGSAMLDVASTAKGMLVPRMDSLHRAGILSPATGLLVYQTDGVTPGFYYFNGTSWTVLGGGAPSGAAGGDLTGTYPNPSIGAGKVTIADLSATGSPSGTTFLRGDNTWSPAGTGTVTSVSIGNLAPFFTTSVTSATTTPAISFSLSNAGAHTFLGNFSGSAAAPSYSSPQLASADFANQGTTTTVLHGNAAGSPSFGSVTTSDIAANAVTVAKLPTGATGTTFLRGDGTWVTPAAGSGVIYPAAFTNPLSTTPPYYIGFFSNGTSTGSPSDVQMPIMKAMTIDALAMYAQITISGTGAADAITVTLLKNGTSTGLTCTITAPPSTSAPLTSTSTLVFSGGPVAVAPGDNLSYSMTQTNGDPTILVYVYAHAQ